MRQVFNNFKIFKFNQPVPGTGRIVPVLFVLSMFILLCFVLCQMLRVYIYCFALFKAFKCLSIVLCGSGVRLYDGLDLKLFILVGWGRSFLSVA